MAVFRYYRVHDCHGGNRNCPINLHQITHKLRSQTSREMDRLTEQLCRADQNPLDVMGGKSSHTNVCHDYLVDVIKFICVANLELKPGGLQRQIACVRFSGLELKTRHLADNNHWTRRQASREPWIHLATSSLLCLSAMIKRNEH
jgi:hypothetical protein